MEGGSIANAQIDLHPLLTQDLMYVWIGTTIVVFIGMLVGLVMEVRKGINKARDSNLSAEEKGRGLFFWLVKHI